MGLAGDTYTNTTGEISAVLDDLMGPPTFTGPPASDDIVVIGAPQLSKVFTDDPVLPGGTVTLEFTLENLDTVNAASAIAFSDDLGATLAGLTLTSELMNTCGGTVGGIGTDMFSYSGGSLAAEATCTIELLLTVPGTPPGGIFPNTTSDVTATVAGKTTISAAASDDLVVSGLVLTKDFTDDPVIAGGMVTLTFTLDNTGGAVDATDITFKDPIDPEVLPGLTATLPPIPDPPCGGTLTTMGLGGGNVEALVFMGGSVPAGTSCSFIPYVELHIKDDM